MHPLLLASVVGPEEAVEALRAGADVLDLKNPSEGALGACTPDIVRAVVAVRNAGGSPSVAVSAALGDAPGLPGTFALAAAGAASCGVDYLKIGLRGLSGAEAAGPFLAAVVRAAREVAPSVRVIAAAYAEARSIGSLEPRLLPSVAQGAGAFGCLIDTAIKNGLSLVDHLDSTALSCFIADCRSRGLMCGLAGSLGQRHLPLLLELGPDVIGVRGAICEGGRSGRLDPLRLRQFRETLLGVPGVPVRSGG